MLLPTVDVIFELGMRVMGPVDMFLRGRSLRVLDLLRDTSCRSIICVFIPQDCKTNLRRELLEGARIAGR